MTPHRRRIRQGRLRGWPRRFAAPTALREVGRDPSPRPARSPSGARRWCPKMRNGRVAPAASSSLVWLRADAYSEPRKATRSDFSCLVSPMLNRVL